MNKGFRRGRGVLVPVIPRTQLTNRVFGEDSLGAELTSTAAEKIGSQEAVASEALVDGHGSR